MRSPTTRTLVVGDMHLKEDAVFAGVDRAIAQLGVERVVFCGDYLDEWHAGTIAYHDGVDALLRWVKRRRSEGIAVDVVLGNHDMQYVLGEPGPGTLMSLVPVARAALSELKAVAASVVGDALVTHAGVTGAWARRFLPQVASGHGEESGTVAVCDALNALLDAGDQKSLYTLASAGPAAAAWRCRDRFGQTGQSSSMTRFRGSTKSWVIRPLHQSSCGTCRQLTASILQSAWCSAIPFR